MQQAAKTKTTTKGQERKIFHPAATNRQLPAESIHQDSMPIPTNHIMPSSTRIGSQRTNEIPRNS